MLHQSGCIASFAAYYISSELTRQKVVYRGRVMCSAAWCGEGAVLGYSSCLILCCGFDTCTQHSSYVELVTLL